MDDLEGRRDVKSDQRIDQFMRLREIIEERASRKFFEEQAQADRPVVLRSNDSLHDGLIVLAPTPSAAAQPPGRAYCAFSDRLLNERRCPLRVKRRHFRGAIGVSALPPRADICRVRSY